MRSQGIKQVLAELELLSHGKTTAFNSSGAGETTAVLPHGESKPPHEYWRDRYNAAGEDERPGVLEHARRELEIWKKRQAPAETDGTTEDDWIIKDGRGFPPDEVARKFKTSVGRVRNLRKAKKLDTETGFAKNAENVVELVVPVQDRIRNLAAQGCTERQIAFQVGVSKTTVRRALGKAA